MVYSKTTGAKKAMKTPTKHSIVDCQCHNKQTTPRMGQQDVGAEKLPRTTV